MRLEGAVHQIENGENVRIPFRSSLLWLPHKSGILPLTGLVGDGSNEVAHTGAKKTFARSRHGDGLPAHERELGRVGPRTIMGR